MIIENAIGGELLGILIDNFESREDQHTYTMGMEKLSDPWHLKCTQFSNYTSPKVSELLTPILDQYIDTSVNVGDTYFKHRMPYHPHADNNSEFDTVNVLIPLQRSHMLQNQYFVVFNQINTQSSGATWMGEYKTPGEFQFNKKRTFPGTDSTVSGTTSEEINEELYNVYLRSPNRPKELFYGLSIDQAYIWFPGDIIIFNSNQIHCSGTMHCEWKLGLSLRFKGSLTDK